MRRLLLLSVAVVAAGCSTDPCGGAAGVCIAARVEGNVGNLDQLNISVATLGSHTSPSVSAGTFTLPVKIGIDLPATSNTSAEITVVGLLGGVAVTAPVTETVVITNNRGTATFNLTASNVPVDLSMTVPPDLSTPMNSVYVLPNTYTFRTATPTGVTSSEVGTLTAYNTTNETVFVGQSPYDMAGLPVQDNSFSPAMTSTCALDPNGMGFDVPIGHCTIDFSFTPTSGGSHKVTYAIAPIGKTSQMVYPVVDLTLIGTGTAAWIGDNGPNGLQAVWGSGPNDIYTLSTNTLFHSQGDGQWTNINAPTLSGRQLMAITGNGPGMVWVSGGDPSGSSGFIAMAQVGGSGVPPPTGLGNFNLETLNTATTSSVGALNWDPSGTPIGLSFLARYQRNASGSWDGDQTIPNGVPFAVRPITLVNSQGAYYKNASGWVPVAGPGFVGPDLGGASSPLRSVWSDGNEVFIVGLAVAASGHGLVWHYTSGLGMTPTIEDPLISGDLLAVTGRDVGAGMTEVWAVGSLGAHVAHRTPDGV